MAGRLRRRMTFANVTSLIALFVALSGTATAAVLITGKNIKDGSISTKDVKNRSLLAADFRRGQLPAGDRGPAGERGAPGAGGATGAQGERGIQGAQGVPGPTMAVSSAGNSGATLDFAPANMPNSLQEEPITTTTAGDLWVTGDITELEINCYPEEEGECRFEIALFLDGTLIPASSRRFTAQPGTQLIAFPYTFAIASDVPAGPHLLELRQGHSGIGSFGYGYRDIAAIALGGQSGG